MMLQVINASSNRHPVGSRLGCSAKAHLQSAVRELMSVRAATSAHHSRKRAGIRRNAERNLLLEEGHSSCKVPGSRLRDDEHDECSPRGHNAMVEGVGGLGQASGGRRRGRDAVDKHVEDFEGVWEGAAGQERIDRGCGGVCGWWDT